MTALVKNGVLCKVRELFFGGGKPEFQAFSVATISDPVYQADPRQNPQFADGLKPGVWEKDWVLVLRRKQP